MSNQSDGSRAEGAAPGAVAPPARTRPPWLLRALLEFIVIFFGVFGAFLAESYREDLAERAEAQRIEASLAEEIRRHLATGEALLLEIEQAEARWRSGQERGESRPPWHLSWRPASFPTAAFDATVGSGGIRLLSRTAFYQVANYYEGLKASVIPLAELDPFVEREIVPYEDDPQHFYDRSTGELRSQYRAYIERRQLMLATARQVLEVGRVVHRRLYEDAYRL